MMFSVALHPLRLNLHLIQEAMHNFVHEMLHDSPAAQRIMALWQV